jgi:hypothetical protein
MVQHIERGGTQVNPILGYDISLVAKMPGDCATKKAILAHVLMVALGISQKLACELTGACLSYLRALIAMDTNEQWAVSAGEVALSPLVNGRKRECSDLHKLIAIAARCDTDDDAIAKLLCLAGTEERAAEVLHWVDSYKPATTAPVTGVPAAE